MINTWEARVVDAGIASAWREWRLRLADHLQATVAEQRCEELTFTAPTGESLAVVVDDVGILVIAGDLEVQVEVATILLGALSGDGDGVCVPRRSRAHSPLIGCCDVARFDDCTWQIWR